MDRGCRPTLCHSGLASPPWPVRRSSSAFIFLFTTKQNDKVRVEAREGEEELRMRKVLQKCDRQMRHEGVGKSVCEGQIRRAKETAERKRK